MAVVGEHFRANQVDSAPIPYKSSSYLDSPIPREASSPHLTQHTQNVGDDHRNEQNNSVSIPYQQSPYVLSQFRTTQNSSHMQAPSYSRDQVAALATNSWSPHYGYRFEERAISTSLSPNSGNNYSSENETLPRQRPTTTTTTTTTTTNTFNMSTSDTTNGQSSASSGTIRQLAASQGLHLAPQSTQTSPRRGSRKRTRVNYAAIEKINDECFSSDSDLSPITTNSYAKKRSSQRKIMISSDDGGKDHTSDDIIGD